MIGDAWRYFRDHQDQVLDWTWNTIYLAGMPLVYGLLLSLPLGWLAARYRWTYPPLITLSGLLYTIPSLALFVLLPGLIGTNILDPTNVVIALTVYTVALLVRVVADALTAVPADVRAAAVAMGFKPARQFATIDLPLAVPVIAAGLRVAAVSNVSLVSVAAAIGVPQLGQLFTDSYRLDYKPPLVLGFALFLLLAFAFDGLIALAARAATPWTR